jgi:hypothetical protein
MLVQMSRAAVFCSLFWCQVNGRSLTYIREKKLWPDIIMTNFTITAVTSNHINNNWKVSLIIPHVHTLQTLYLDSNIWCFTNNLTERCMFLNSKIFLCCGMDALQTLISMVKPLHFMHACFVFALLMSEEVILRQLFVYFFPHYKE